MFVRNWMSTPIVSIPPVVPVEGALSFMEERGFRRLPVMDGDKLLGIVTKSDLHAALGKKGDADHKQGMSVEDVMTRDPITIPQDETLERASQTMLKAKISGLPVLDGEKVVGIVTESDLFRALCEIMGMHEAGARIILTVNEDEDLLATIGKRLNGLGLQSLATYHNPTTRRWEVVLRVRGRVPA